MRLAHHGAQARVQAQPARAGGGKAGAAGGGGSVTVRRSNGSGCVGGCHGTSTNQVQLQKTARARIRPVTQTCPVYSLAAQCSASARINPSTVYSAAITSTGRPALRATSAVTGPRQATSGRGSASGSQRGSRRAKLRAAEPLVKVMA